VKQTWAVVSKAGKLLGYEADYSIDKGLSEFSKWYKSNSKKEIA
jgi:nucleoside-diphosphate-sugar epimerase